MVQDEKRFGERQARAVIGWIEAQGSLVLCRGLRVFVVVRVRSGQVEMQLCRIRVERNQLFEDLGGAVVVPVLGIGYRQVRLEALGKRGRRGVRERLLQVVDGRRVPLLVDRRVRKIKRGIGKAGIESERFLELLDGSVKLAETLRAERSRAISELRSLLAPLRRLVARAA